MYDILGYFVHREDDLHASNVMVVIDEGYEFLTCYLPIGQHSEMSRDYFEECLPITKEQYIAASKRYYTPEEYLQ